MVCLLFIFIDNDVETQHLSTLPEKMQFSLPQKFTFISFLLPCFVAETTKRNLLDRSAGAWLKSKRNPRKADKSCVRLAFIHQQQSGAVEACWAHNPEVRGSKPRSANNFFFFKIAQILNSSKLSTLNRTELFGRDSAFFPFGKSFKYKRS